jgi:hypothetical protein
MHKLIEYICDELEEMERKASKGGKLSMSELQYADTLAHLKKNLLKSQEMEGGDEYSMRYSRRMSYADGDSYRGDSYAYPEENYVKPDGSYSRRGRNRDSMGRYSSEGSVDEHTKEELRKLIEKM